MGLEVYGGLVFPFVSITPDENGSLWNLYPAPTPAYPDAPTRFMFGVVDGINYLGTKLAVGDRVLFDSNDAVLVTQANVQYYLLDETKSGSLFKENPEPPAP